MNALLSHFRFLAPLVFLLSFLILTIPVTQALAQAQTTNQELSAEQIIAIAEADASEDTNATIYGLGGFCCGIFGWLFAMLSKPDVPSARLVGKSADYVTVYSNAYRNKVKSLRTHAACVGWAIGTTVSIVVNLVVLAQKDKNSNSW